MMGLEEGLALTGNPCCINMGENETADQHSLSRARDLPVRPTTPPSLGKTQPCAQTRQTQPSFFQAALGPGGVGG